MRRTSHYLVGKALASYRLRKAAALKADVTTVPPPLTEEQARQFVEAGTVVTRKPKVVKPKYDRFKHTKAVSRG